jgi:hypothetical protein
MLKPLIALMLSLGTLAFGQDGPPQGQAVPASAPTQMPTPAPVQAPAKPAPSKPGTYLDLVTSTGLVKIHFQSLRMGKGSSSIAGIAAGVFTMGFAGDTSITWKYLVDGLSADVKTANATGIRLTGVDVKRIHGTFLLVRLEEGQDLRFLEAKSDGVTTTPKKGFVPFMDGPKAVLGEDGTYVINFPKPLEKGHYALTLLPYLATVWCFDQE